MCKLAILTPFFNEGLNSTWTKYSRDGWKTFIVPEDDEQYKVVHFKLHGVQNNIQATQEQILGQFDKPASIPVQLLLLLCKKIVKLSHLD